MDECTLNNLLECSVCLERLDTSSKVLPCQHTFCKACLEEILTTQRELRCPECRILVESSIEDLPPNVLLMRILEGMKNSGNPVEKKKVASGSSFSKQQEGATGTQDGISTHHPCHNNVEHSKLQSGLKHNPLPMVPYCIAMYDYTSQEAGDLHFKKGAVILLNRKVDEHWYEGELDGLVGIFPLNYVQVVKPLSEQEPTCRALYNFRIANEDDEGQSLTFKKNDVITVIRRVDENWGEGRLNDRIGIFPLAFVQMNQAAEALLEKSMNSLPGPSRVVPPAPVTEESVPLLISDDPSQSSKLSVPVLSSPSTTTSSFSVTPTSSSSTSSTSNSAPNSPPTCQPPTSSNPFLPQSPLQRLLQTTHITKTYGLLPTSHIGEPQAPSSRQEVVHAPLLVHPGELSAFCQPKGKRHSFSALTPTPQNGSNSTPTSSKPQGEKSNVESGSNNVNGRLSRHGSQRHRRSGSDYVVTAKELDRYVALYPYKPQKADELELQKGGVYHVTEFCQDGWFKGISVKTQQTGVFPGNYVTLAKKLPIVLPSSAYPCPPPCRPRSVQQVKVVKHQRVQEQQQQAVPLQQHVQSQLEQEQHQAQQPQQQQQLQQQQLPQKQKQQQQLIVPPELPPRVPSPSARQAKSSSQNCSSFWNFRPEEEPLSIDHGTFIDISSFFPLESKPKRPGALQANAATPTKSTEKTKDKKEKSGLIKRLTTMKRSKSPPESSTSYSMDNPVFDDASAAAAAVTSRFLQAFTHSQPVHSRSGSCPSQLIHVPEVGTNHRIISASVSARMKHRERPSVSNASFMHSTSRQMERNSILSSPITSSHRKSNSLDAGEARKPKQLVPAIRERFRCIVPYPPNSEYELELKVGDIIYVHKKREDGWYKGTQQRTGRTGLFPASFVETY